MHKLSVAATEYPVSLEEQKQHLRVEHDDEDGYIGSLIAAATGYVESRADRQLCTATWTLKCDGFPYPSCPIELPKPPLASVTSVAYVDTAGSTQTWASSNYTVDTQSEPGSVRPVYSGTWPTARGHVNDVTITYVAGYGAASAVPEVFKHAIKLLVGHLYESREAVVVDQGFSGIVVPLGVEALIAQGEWTLR
jgi:uncharacterized phiE125 gp8 family phage protein